MKIWKFELTIIQTQFVKMPLKSKILDIQMQNGNPVLWALVDTDMSEIKAEVKINMYGTGWEIYENVLEDEYLATVQEGELVWHFFLSLE